MHCPKCGAENRDGSDYCANCGATFETINPFEVGVQSVENHERTWNRDVVNVSEPVPQTFCAAIKVCFRKYFRLRGRASRSEYWFWVLFVILTFWCPIVMGIFLALIDVDAGANCLLVPMILAFVYACPGICVGVRRLHDIGRSGGFVLLKIVPFCIIIIYVMSMLFLEFAYDVSIEEEVEESPWIAWCNLAIIGLYLAGKFVLVILACLPGQKGANKYGAAPVKHVQ